MTETEFLEASEALMQQVENAVDAAELDVECDRTGNVLTIEADSGEQIGSIVIRRRSRCGLLRAKAAFILKIRTASGATLATGRRLRARFRLL